MHIITGPQDFQEITFLLIGNWRLFKMSSNLRTTWTVNGVSLARNPDSYSMTWDKANVTYEKQADGSQRRIHAPRLQTAVDMTLTWKFAPRRVVRSIMQQLNQSYPLPGFASVLGIGGIQPDLVCKCFFDTPKLEMSKDNLSTKTGEGGALQDLTVMLRSDEKGFQSANFVPQGSSATPTNVASAFGGPIGNYLDYLPKWDGVSYWQQSFASSSNITIYNLGDQEWNPFILINGPFSTFALTELFADVDGTGKGVQFLWTGAPVTNGAIRYDTFQNRCYTVVPVGSTSVTTEVYTFSLQTVSDGQPFSYFPGMLVGSNSFNASATGSFTSNTHIDFSNQAQERFRYWA